MVYINSQQVADIIADRPRLVATWVKQALYRHYKKEVIQPNKTYLQVSDNPYDRIIALPACIKEDKEIIGLKWIGSHSKNVSRGIERANAVIILNNNETMAPEIIIDGSLISSMRTLAISIISLDLFIRDDFTVGIIGMGKLGKLHARHIVNEFPNIKGIYCFSNNADFSEILDNDKIQKVNNIEAILKNCNVIITTSNAVEPYISDYSLGSSVKLILNLSLMDFHLDVIQKSQRIIVDDWEQNISAKKVFRKGFENGSLTKKNVEELSQVLFTPARATEGRIFVNPLGMGIEDIYVADKVRDLIERH